MKRTNKTDEKEIEKKQKTEQFTFIVILADDNDACEYGIRGELNEPQKECLLNAAMKHISSNEVQAALYLIGEYPMDYLKNENDEIRKMVEELEIIERIRIVLLTHENNPRYPVFISLINMF